MTSVTFMHGSDLPLKTWFPAAHLMATDPNGISAPQLQVQLGIGSYRSAHPQASTSDSEPDRTLLLRSSELGQASVPCQPETSTPEAAGQSPEKGGKDLLGRGSGALGEGRAKTHPTETDRQIGEEQLRTFFAWTVKPGARIVTDSWSRCSCLPENPEEAQVVGDPGAHEILNWLHHVLSKLKRLAIGVLHGLEGNDGFQSISCRTSAASSSK